MRLLLAATCVALLLTACGGGGGDDDDDPEDKTRTPRPERTSLVQETATRERDDRTPASSPTPGGPGSERSNPVPIGTPVEIAGWSIIVKSVTPNATARIATENSFNEPPAAGNQYFLATVAATYLGDGEEESKALIDDLEIASVADSNLAYDTFDASCGSVPDELDTFREVFKGGTITGNLCWEILSADVPSMAMYVDWFFEDERVWLSLK